MKKNNALSSADFGEQLRIFRSRVGMNQRELAGGVIDAGLNCDFTSISHWESGRRYPPLETLIVIIQVLVEAGGIERVEEANNLLQLANMRSLNEDEVAQIFGDLPSTTEPKSTASVPDRPSEIGKFNVHIAGDVRGFIQGDHTQVTMTFDDRPSKES